MSKFFNEPSMLKVPSQCTTCMHWQGGRRCTAFTSIPESIWSNKADHRKPFEGDGGTRFAWKAALPEAA